MAQAVARLRQLLADESKIIVCPGVFDGLTARIALNEGFDALYMTGAGTAASVLGQPDLGILTLNEMRGNAEMIANLNTAVPLIADADTGFGGSLMVHRTVTEYIRSGVAALHLEDQVTTKRCGHLRNKQLVDEDEFLSRIQAAVNARKQSGGDIVLIARTDALQSLGYDAAMSRLKRAIGIGADVAFLEGVRSKEEAQNACKELSPTPVLFNSVPGGVSPDLSVPEAQELGFRVIIFPGLALGSVHGAVSAAVKMLKRDGVPPASEGVSPRDLFNVVGLKQALMLDAAAGGKSFENGV
ncbi:putative carboxyphosphonoenolpyruvate mutase [Talaromyces proteolyticus]|uniref:Carboxyphosphonoenolpyruvate mutase n=1 Tax=Talaromyces proteolyticus TaxID=1131652 RepID=A0AAD4KMX5_9EURO|nr:putative carboxyphosphonoenolpyruvate mutase [Talaromyces proteolyticus]KAH8691620.1 putative carboxyphosphonoenolpyruvate mutase [Talaromyces proteolyticus]